EQAFTQADIGCTPCFQIHTTPRSTDWVQYDRRARSPVINEKQSGRTEINWQLPPLVRGEATTLRLHYQVRGALQVLADHQQLNWTAFSPERTGRVDAASVRLHLPPGLAPAAVQIDGSGGAVQAQADGSVLITSAGHVPAERSWGIRVSLPAQATTA